MNKVEEEGLKADLAAVLKDATKYVTGINVANGWHDDTRTFGDDIALLHSEVSEMFEEWRGHGMEDYTDVHEDAKPQGVASEAADIFIRLLDTCDRYNIDLAAEFIRKMRYNATRGYKHGGKRV